MDITEGYMAYLGYRTYYRVVGSLGSSKPPLVLLLPRRARLHT